MKKNINYFVQALLIYFLFFIGRILGIKISRIVFSFLFSVIGPFFKSKKIIQKNLNIFQENISEEKKKKIINDMWKNYGMTFIEYVFLNNLKKKNFSY